MLLREFIDKYCDDILQSSKKEKELLDLDDFPYDEIVRDADDQLIKVIYSADGDIPINDILGLDRAEFAKAYPTPKSMEAYDSYVESILIIEGEEALMRIRNLMIEQQKEIAMYAQLPEEL